MKRFLHCFAVFLFTSTIVAAAQPKPAQRPNIVLLLADDLGWRDLGVQGAAGLATPHIDALAAQGVRFTNFYSNGPECSPTRAALLTGRYQQRVGGLECAIGIGGVGRYDDAIRLAERNELGLPAEEISIARLLKQAGYRTALIGKWHLGYEEKFSPNQHGFDHAFYCIGGGMDYFHHVEDPPVYAPALRLNGRQVARSGYFTDLIAEDSIRWLRRNASGEDAPPFFLFVPFTAPHSPFQAPDEKQPEPLPPDSTRWKQGSAPPAVYTAMIERMDHAVGRILAELEKLQVAQDTLIIFASDNGGTRSARPTGLHGIKGMTFEGGIRVPGVVRWPGVLPAGVDFEHPAMTIDLTASIAHAAGVAPAQDRPFDGVDILQFAQRGEAPPERSLFWRGRRGQRTWRAVREGAMKYVSLTNGAKHEEWLFDLHQDPGEEQNLLSKKPDVVAGMKRRLASWETEVRPVR